MKRKPDLMLMLTLVFVLGLVATSYAQNLLP
jgi:hypothetical protein